eukprot:TRINITY_DN106016_c0_g1_i1.p1 TRINITY_DN106016_c0_g1~~TRINITY_DN106016_c0_g1_i1.p1  ORF type:complete len:206 (+),score=26.22 TRINITY_DN106016_c0_g1_i1:82-618(+)
MACVNCLAESFQQDACNASASWVGEDEEAASLRLLQLAGKKVSGSCDTSGCPQCSGQPCPVCVQMKEIDCCLDDACHGCSGETCPYCRNLERKKCCAGKWMGKYTGKCEGVDLPDYESCPKCSGAPCPVCIQSKDVDACLEDACHGCGGEQCTYCRKDHRATCCAGKNLAAYLDACKA